MSDSEVSMPDIPQYEPPPANYRRPIVVDSTPDVDITSLAMEKYREFKEEYGLVPFEVVDQSKKV